jgi:hypothetical protein
MEISCIESIYGTPRIDVEWQAAVVVQGPHYGEITRDVIRNFLGYNSRILVIVSTYSPEDDDLSRHLSAFENHMVLEGVLIYVFVKPPSEAEAPDFWRTNRWNQNLQRLTSSHSRSEVIYSSRRLIR